MHLLPPHGECFIECKNVCDIESISLLVKLASRVKLPAIRITGGEPLLFPDRVERILSECYENYLGKIILNTNGSFLHNNWKMLSKYKEIFLLKISFDTLSERHFNRIINRDLYKQTYDNLICAIDLGFSIEINTVINKVNKHQVIDLISFADEKGVDIKLFGVNAYEGMIDYDNVYADLSEIVEILDNKYQRCNNEKLRGNRGISMLKYKLTSDCYVWVLEHSQKSQYNREEKHYSQNCLECKYYPCSTGRFSIMLRADGLLQGCRMIPENGINISERSCSDIKNAFEQILSEYSNCFEFSSQTIKI